MGSDIYNNIQNNVQNDYINIQGNYQNISNRETESLVGGNASIPSQNNETELLTEDNGKNGLLFENNQLNQVRYNGTIVEENNFYSGQTQILDDNKTEVLYETNELADFQLLEEIVLCTSSEIVV